MPDDGRYEEVVTCSRGIFQRFGVHPEAVTPHRLAKVIYTVLEAINASERRPGDIPSPDERNGDRGIRALPGPEHG